MQTIEITKEEAKMLLKEARINVPGKLDVYQNVRGMLYRVFTLDVPIKWDNSMPDLILYARENIPEELNF